MCHPHAEEYLTMVGVIVVLYGRNVFA